MTSQWVLPGLLSTHSENSHYSVCQADVLCVGMTLDRRSMTRSAAIMIVALIATMSFLGSAVANEKAEEPQSSLPTPLIVVDEEAGTMVIALPVDGELPECGDVTAAFTKTDGYGPGDCIEIVIEHPSGKINHGAIVSAAAKELHPSTLDGIKKGEIMRWVAKAGKGGGDEEEPGAVDPSDKENNGKSDEAPGKDPEKNADKPGNGNNPGNKDNPGNGGDKGNGRDNPGRGNGPGNGNGPKG